MNKIVGISLIKDEDIFIETILNNVIDFCDEIIVVDNGSTDATFEIVSELSVKHPKISLHRGSLADSSKAIYKYINSNTWILGVDGDEIFSPNALDNLKPSIVNGKYDNFYGVRGHSFNATDIDWKKNLATGFTAPPSRPQVKLHNFKIIKSWKGGLNTERLHGSGCERLPNEGMYEFYKDGYSWKEDPLRCLHACFCQRSSLDPENKRQFIDHPCAGGARWKQIKYAKGHLTTINIKEFNNE